MGSNVARAEQGIRAEQTRIKLEGKVDDPFTRRKTRPVLSMPKKEEPAMTSELLLQLEEERKANEDKKQVKMKIGKENIDNLKQPKTEAEAPNIFNAHDFDIILTLVVSTLELLSLQLL